jgi:hypothetical protein
MATRRCRGHQGVHLSKPCEEGLEAVSQDCPFSPSARPLAELVSRATTAASVPSPHVPAHGRAKPELAVRLLRVASLPSFTFHRTSSTPPRNNQAAKHRRRPPHQAPAGASWLLRRGGSPEVLRAVIHLQITKVGHTHAPEPARRPTVAAGEVETRPGTQLLRLRFVQGVFRNVRAV